MKQTLLILLAMVFFSSCDSVYTYEYRIKNGADTAVQVHYHFRSQRDTTIMLMTDEEQLICTTSHGVEAHKGPYFQTVDHDIDSVVVMRRGHRSVKNFSVDGSWIFSIARPVGMYNALVSTGDF